MFKDFGRRLQRDIKRAVDMRIQTSEQLSGGAPPPQIATRPPPAPPPPPPPPRPRAPPPPRPPPARPLPAPCPALLPHPAPPHPAPPRPMLRPQASSSRCPSRSTSSRTTCSASPCGSAVRCSHPRPSSTTYATRAPRTRRSAHPSAGTTPSSPPSPCERHLSDMWSESRHHPSTVVGRVRPRASFGKFGSVVRRVRRTWRHVIVSIESQTPS
jgi:hypothetical protein